MSRTKTPAREGKKRRKQPPSTSRRRPGKPARPGPRPASVAKISITVDSAVLTEARRFARRSGKTLSAHVSEALARDVRRRRLEALVEEFETEHGEITEEELAEVRLAWQA